MVDAGVRPNRIGGDWRDGPDALVNENPSDLDAPVGRYAVADAGDVRAAVDAALEAAPGWAAMAPRARAALLDAICDELAGRADELGRLLSAEEGKTLPEGVGEVRRAAEIFRFYAGEALRVGGDLLPGLRPGIDVEVRHRPIGAVGLVTPWNFPIAIPAWKLAPALAYGNTAVLKPSELAPGCAWALVEVAVRAGLPDGVVNLVMGGGDVGAALVADGRLAGLSFTGSTATGRQVAVAAAERFTRVQLEMGGKNPLVVLDDADLDLAVACAWQGAYLSTGQRCTASSRLIVTEGIADRFVAALADRVRSLRVGHALDPASELGPVIDERQLAKDEAAVREALDAGASAVVLGTRLARGTRGRFLGPTLFDHTAPDMAINREEVFGPVASILRVPDLEAALAAANDTEQLLVAGVVTRSLAAAAEFRRRTRAGMAMVNLPTAGMDYHAPFGGSGASSYGPREQGPYAKAFFTEVTAAYVRA
jgi:aldehyde dehydrogenase (NAD+)